MFDRRSLNNPLQRRITRHTNLATLFRRPSEAPTVQGLGYAASSPAPQVASREPAAAPQIQPVKARLLPAESRLPQAILLPRLPVMSARPGTLDDSPFPAAAAIQPRPAAGSSPDPIQTALEPASPQRAVPPAALPAQSPAAPSAAAPEDDDPTWRRLQTIFHRHQEVQEADQAPTGHPQPTGAALADRTPDLDGSQLQPAAEASSDLPEPQAGQPALRPPAAPTGPIQAKPAAQPPASVTREQGQPSASAPQANPVESQPIEPAQKLPLQEVWPVQRATQAAPHQQPGPSAEPEQTAPSPPAASPPAASRPEARQPAPAQQPDRPSGPGEDRSMEADQPDPSLAYLQRVKSGQPSASSIEVIPPRRPPPIRPDAIRPDASRPDASRIDPIRPETSRPEPAFPPQPSLEQPTQPAASAPPPGSSPAGQPEAQPPSGQMPSAEAKTQIQTQKEPTKPAPAAPQAGARPRPPESPRQIPTEIGPLPEDLWTLLGAEPPRVEGDTAPYTPPGAAATLVTSPAPAAGTGDTPPPAQPGVPPVSPAAETPPSMAPAGQVKTSPEPPSEGPARAAAIQRAIAVAESKPAQPEPPPSPPAAEQPATFGPITDVLPPIQRRAVPGPAARGSAAGPGQEADASQPAESELDLDALARQVYSQLRRRLEIESERLHRRG